MCVFFIDSTESGHLFNALISIDIDAGPSGAGFEATTLKTVHFIIPLAGRYDTLKRFLGNFEKVCLASGENVKLAVILFKVARLWNVKIDLKFWILTRLEVSFNVEY